MNSGPRSPNRSVVLAVVLSVVAAITAVGIVSYGAAQPGRQASPSAAERTLTRTVTVVKRTTPAARTHASHPTPSAQPTVASPTPSPAAAAHAMCEANIRVKTTTTCPFAQNVFFAYWAHETYPGTPLTAYSSAAARTFDLDCAPGVDRVQCTAGDGAEVSFPQSAVDAYDLSQAKQYAAKHRLGTGVPWSDEGDTSAALPTQSATPRTVVPDTSSTSSGENILRRGQRLPRAVRRR